MPRAGSQFNRGFNALEKISPDCAASSAAVAQDTPHDYRLTLSGYYGQPHCSACIPPIDSSDDRMAGAASRKAAFRANIALALLTLSDQADYAGQWPGGPWLFGALLRFDIDGSIADQGWWMVTNAVLVSDQGAPAHQ